MSGKKQKADAEEIDELKRAERIIELRRTGATWELIAKATGYANASGAYKAYQRITEQMVIPKLEEYRAMELDMLDRLQFGIYERAKNGDTKAISTVLSISDRRARILGLDAPTKIQAEVVTYDATILEQHTSRIIELVRQTREQESAVGGTDGETRAITNGE